jgi:hypothetical protein
LLSLARRSTAVGVFVIGLFLFQFASPLPSRVQQAIARDAIGFHEVARSNESFRRIENALRGQHIFSTAEQFARLDPAPALINAFALWTFNPQPIYDRIRSGEFDVVITPLEAQTWRGVDHISPNLRGAIIASYAPQCTIRGVLVYFPRNRPADNGLLQSLNQIGCAPFSVQQSPARPNL